MKRRKDLLGKRFGHLVVIREDEYKSTKSRAAHWICRCDCGKVIRCRSDNLTTGHTTQCSICSPSSRKTSVFINEVVEV